MDLIRINCHMLWSYAQQLVETAPLENWKSEASVVRMHKCCSDTIFYPLAHLNEVLQPLFDASPNPARDLSDEHST
jgi:hypothetical protein